VVSWKLQNLVEKGNIVVVTNIRKLRKKVPKLEDGKKKVLQ